MWFELARRRNRPSRGQPSALAGLDDSARAHGAYTRAAAEESGKQRRAWLCRRRRSRVRRFVRRSPLNVAAPLRTTAASHMRNPVSEHASRTKWVDVLCFAASLTAGCAKNPVAPESRQPLTFGASDSVF